ncbi:putative carbohydrate kinase [Glomus cerebriforme]|uniref:Xylulose kinase n=1 Tax=Glomus cerebriforme TaxID=658196 RepID=A0A397TNG7_9GLOM|nr:putative carbohydrate kinase [Glomus cerebriforme]
MSEFDDLSNLYIGFDLSTQQLKLTAIEDTYKIVFEDIVHFDKELPHYGTRNGVISNGETVTCPTLMWVESLDILLQKLKIKEFPFGKVRMISGAGQQHGSIYWSHIAPSLLSSLDPSQPLAHQLKNAFSVQQSPTWQDSSTSEQCHQLEELIGGAEVLVNLTGSKAYERFTGNQIAKICKTNPTAFSQTSRISLVSSFLATLFLGHYAPIDISDGSGMNLLNIHTKKWEDKLLHICSCGAGRKLKEKLGEPEIDGLKILGNVHEYFVKRYGFNKDCKIIPFTGDNPATLLSFNIKPGNIVISLGTSDTVLLYTSQPSPTSESHTLCHPIMPTSYFSMLCYKNGSLTREYIRDIYTKDASWKRFNNILDTSKPIKSKIGFYFLLQEIIPFAKGIFRFDNNKLVKEFDDPNHNVRAIIESQFLSMKLRINKLLRRDKEKIQKLIVVGGASKNDQIVKVLADVFGTQVWRIKSEGKGGNSASMGAAVKARMAFLKQEFKNTTNLNYDEIEGNYLPVTMPKFENTKFYDNMIENYQELEKLVIQSQL